MASYYYSTLRENNVENFSLQMVWKELEKKILNVLFLNFIQELQKSIEDLRKLHKSGG